MNYHRYCTIAATLAAAMLFSFFAYIAAWYMDKVEGNFALLLFLASAGTGLFWLADRLYFRRHYAAVSANKVVQPWWLDWTSGLFPVIFIVFLLRSFLFEPFKIPSGSMIPTLQIGDLILVNKFHYGLRLPVLNTKITGGTPVARGDVMVFRYPPKPGLDYIKRVVGLPGDSVEYINKRLTINGKAIQTMTMADYVEKDTGVLNKQFEEVLDGKKHRFLNNDRLPAGWDASYTETVFLFRQNCEYSDLGVRCTVPPGHYFMMGDNRDNSLDSRYFGFVPEANIVGRAVVVWMNFGNLSRIGAFD